jgi:hypothetical protein
VAHWALATLDLGHGRFETALDRLETTARGPARHQMDVTYYAPDQIEAVVRLGRPDRATQPLARFTAWADIAQRPWAHALLYRRRALTGPNRDADDNYIAALRLHADTGRPFENARTELLYGEWLRRARRRQTPAATCATPWPCSNRAERGPGPTACAPSCARPAKPTRLPWPGCR